MAKGARATDAGFTLIELLIVIALMGILAAIVMPSANPAVRDQLVATAQIVAGDLAHARSLAVMNNTSYRFTFDLVASSYTLQHCGTSSSFNTLPASLFENPSSPPPTRYVVDFDDLAHIGPTVRLYVVGTGDLNTVTQITQMDFGPLGGLSTGQDVYFWLTAGNGTSQRYIYVQVSGATGLATAGDYGGSPPSVLWGS